MGIFDFLKGPDINQGVQEFNDTVGAFLLDVRTPQEYKNGHIPGSINVPLQSIDDVIKVVGDKNAPVFVHCLSGNRSGRAVDLMRTMGYTNVKNIGGISVYRGTIEKL